MKKNYAEIEETSKKGFHIKVRPARSSFIIFKPDGNPERLNLSNPNEIINPLKTVVFIGSGFRLRSVYQGLSFLPVVRNRILIPYRHEKLTKEKVIFIHTTSNADIFPLNVDHLETVEQLLNQLKGGKPVQYLVVDDQLPRTDILLIKQKLPKVYLFVIKVSLFVKNQNLKVKQSLLGEKIDNSRVRAVDLMQHGDKQIEFLSDNPVFLARVFLRNLELQKIRSLLLEKDIEIKDLDYIRTFLEIMIKNEHQKPELAKVKEELELLKKYILIQEQFLSKDLELVSESIQKETDKEVINFYNFLIKKDKESAESREEKISYWELEAVVKSRLAEIKDND